MAFSKAIYAGDHLRFSGERIVEVRQGADRKVHTELMLQDGLNTRVWFKPDSPLYGQVIVETSKERRHYYPRRHVIEVLPPKREEAFLRLRQWVQHPGRTIRLSVGKGDIVAGRQTDLGIVSDAKGNIRQRLWMDSQTGLVLKRELLDNVGDRRDYFEYTSINYSPVIEPDDFRINVRGAQIVTLFDKVRILSNQHQMLNVVLPSSTGFTLDNVNMISPQNVQVMHQVYVGPRGILAFYQVQGVVDLQAFRPTNNRGVQLFSWNMDGKSFALVGTYPIAEMRELAQVLSGPRNGP
jgi:outer membrane lipoprotein-sorting protein